MRFFCLFVCFCRKQIVQTVLLCHSNHIVSLQYFIERCIATNWFIQGNLKKDKTTQNQNIKNK
jgi:hypothetical protein